MPVFYSLVARDQIVLADHASASGNFEVIALRALSELTLGDTQRCIESGSFRVFTSLSKKLCYLCITDPVFPSGRAFQLLANIERALFTEKLYVKAMKARPYALRVDFGERLASEMSAIEGNHVHKLKHKNQQVQHALHQNIERVVERGEKLTDLMDRSEALSLNSADFNRTATKLRRNIMCKSVKLWIVLFVIIGIVVAVIIVLIVLLALHKI